jgi:hypothetical protein
MTATYEGEYVALPDGTVVNPETGEIVETTVEEPVRHYTALALEAKTQHEEWEAAYNLYRLVLKQLGVTDATTPAGHAVLRGRKGNRKATREAWGASLLVQALPWPQRAHIVLSAFKELDPGLLDPMVENGVISSAIYDDLVSRGKSSEWVEVRPNKQIAPTSLKADGRSR